MAEPKKKKRKTIAEHVAAGGKLPGQKGFNKAAVERDVASRKAVAPTPALAPPPEEKKTDVLGGIKTLVSGIKEGKPLDLGKPSAEQKELILDFVLIMYDIPAVERKLRRRFIQDALAMGAEQYTESVYLLPFSEKALEMANGLESA